MEPNFVDFNSDIYSYEYFLQDDVCRLCWCKKPETEIISWKMKTQSHNKFTLFDKIQDCLDLDLTQMLFPQQACRSCCDNVEKFLKFRTDCKERERKLIEILKQKNENVKIEKEEILNLEFIKTDFVVNDAIFFDGLHSDISDVDKTGKRCDDETRKSKKCKYKHKNTATFCRSCKIDCKSKESLSKHNDEWHGIEEGSEGKLYKCFGCGKKHTSIKARRSHEVNFCKDMKDGYKCSSCERFLPLRSMYLAHKKAHRENKPVHIPEDIFQCNKCSKLFKTKDCLRKHLAEHIKRNFICETCGRVFTRRDYLNKHKPIHTGTKHLSCPHCDYKTSQQSSLVVHIRKHTGERPYSCVFCPLKCISSSNLQAHLRRHNGIKQYECNICNKKFGYKLSLEEHITSIHECLQTTFACEHCGATFKRNRGLKRHLSAKHVKIVKENELKADNEKCNKNDLNGCAIKQNESDK